MCVCVVVELFEFEVLGLEGDGVEVVEVFVKVVKFKMGKVVLFLKSDRVSLIFFLCFSLMVFCNVYL